MSELDHLYGQIAALPPDERGLVQDFVAYLHWRRRLPESAAADKRPWRYNFVEHLDEAEIRASKDAAGLEVKAAIAPVGGVLRPAIWHHPPVSGEALVTFHVPIPVEVRNLRLRFSTGVRDGSQGADQLIAYRVRVDGWQIWSRAGWPTHWEPGEIDLPFQAGNVLELAFATDGLGRHPWAWAAWADPELVGDLAE